MYKKKKIPKATDVAIDADFIIELINIPKPKNSNPIKAYDMYIRKTSEIIALAVMLASLYNTQKNPVTIA